jgi:hypothetical protein
VILVIHNPKSHDRDTHVRHQLKSQNITDWEYTPAVLHPNTRTGVALAHKNAVSQFENHEMGIIFEDDITFTSRNSWKLFMEGFDLLPPDWDIYLGGLYFSLKFQDLGNGLATCKDFGGLHCYAISERFYKRFLKCPIQTHIDRWCVGANIYVKYPFVAMQKGDYSEREGKAVNYANRIKKYQVLTDQE